MSRSGSSNDGSHGNLTVSFGRQAEKAEGTREDVRVNVGETKKSFDEVVSELETFGKKVNAAEIPYRPVTRNSNSFAHQAVEVVTGDRPKPAAWAPGSGKRLKTDAPEKH